MNNFDTVAQVFQNKDKTFSNWKSFYTKWKDTSGCVKQWSVLAVLLFHRYSFPERNHACCTSVFPFVQWILCSLQTLAYWPMWNKTLIIQCKERPDCYYMVESIWFVHTKWDQTLRVQQASTTKRDEHSQIYHHWDVVCTRLYCLMRLRFQSHPEKTVTEITRLHAWILGWLWFILNRAFTIAMNFQRNTRSFLSVGVRQAICSQQFALRFVIKWRTTAIKRNNRL